MENDWTSRMANDLAKTFGNSDEYWVLILESAQELKTVRLKILLAQCYQIILHSKTNKFIANCDDALLEAIWETSL